MTRSRFGGSAGDRSGPGLCGLNGSETLLDLGCGDGLIGFAALEQLPRGRVIFSDISAELVERCQGTAAELGVAERCEFLVTGADDLGALEDGSVDVVSATGSRSPSLAGACWATTSARCEVAAKVRAAMEARAEESTLMDFDERDLFEWAGGRDDRRRAERGGGRGARGPPSAAGRGRRVFKPSRVCLPDRSQVANGVRARPTQSGGRDTRDQRSGVGALTCAAGRPRAHG